MDRPGPEEQKHKDHDTTAKIMDPQDNGNSPVPPSNQTGESHQSRHVSFDEVQIEARRASNRASAQKSRLRTKLTIKALEQGHKELRATNAELRMLLNSALLQNCQLRRTVEEKHEVILEQNRVLQHLLKCHEHQRSEEQHHAFRGRNLPTSVSRLPHESSLPSRSVIDSAKGLLNLDPINGYPGNGNEGNDLASISNKPYSEARPTSRSVIESSQGLTRRDFSNRNSSAAATNSDKRDTPSNIKILYLQEELKRLKKRTRR
jgi:hypothetical protein